MASPAWITKIWCNSTSNVYKKVYGKAMTKDYLLTRIETKPTIMFGKPVIRGTRLPAEMILGKLAYYADADQIFIDYPFLTKEDIKAVYLYVARTLSLHTIVDVS